MADFADDQDFKDAHEEPRAATVEGKGETIAIPTADGTDASAYALMSKTKSNKYLLVIHEWWGLNDNIKEEAERLFGDLADVNVLALDMYDGKFATTPDDAGKLMQAVKEERAKAIIQGAIDMAGADAQFATIGWCFGGGWSLKSSILAGEQGVGCVMYYGMPVQSADEIAPLQADVLGIFAEQDGWITPEVATKFEDMAKAAGKNIEIHQYDAKHAFANPSSEAYLKDAAQDANAKALAFLKMKFES
ncbi:MAG: dienelactone hydrolase family protein [Bacteroidota bacterium]